MARKRVQPRAGLLGGGGQGRSTVSRQLPPYLDFVHGNGAADRKPHDQRLCDYRQDLTALFTGALPCWRSSWPT